MSEGGAEKECQLISVVPAALHAEWVRRFSSLLAGFRPAALILAEPSQHMAELARLAAQAELALLLTDDIDTAATLGCGVHLNSAGAVAKARAALGGSAVIGASCGLSRHEAMVAGEEGADYVAFPLDPTNPEPAIDLSSWWSEVTEIPAALICREKIPEAGILHASSADFIMLWESAAAGESLEAAQAAGLSGADRG